MLDTPTIDTVYLTFYYIMHRRFLNLIRIIGFFSLTLVLCNFFSTLFPTIKKLSLLTSIHPNYRITKLLIFFIPNNYPIPSHLPLTL